MRFNNLQYSFFVVSIILLIAAPLAAEDMTGLQVIENVYNRPTGEDMLSDLRMTLTNARGDQRVREIKQYLKDFGSEEKKIMFFLSPADVRETSFMNWSYDEEGRDDDQWIYLPALKKVKRISSDSKSDSFMGSDFTYDDLGDRHPSEDTHTVLKEDTVNGEECFVVESIPKEEEYMYSRTVTWVVKDRWVGAQKEFYDEDGDLLKILTVKKYEQISGYWIVLDTEMRDVQEEHTTLMEMENVVLDSGIADKTFTERIMRRGVR